jgi:DNA-binding NarL/FixJ family response regulator
MNSVRVALVNDQPLFSRGLALLLPAVTESRVTIIATTSDGTRATALVRQHRPDLAVVDLAIPAPGGYRTISAMHRSEPELPIIAMGDNVRADHGPRSADDQLEQAVAAVRAGAVGYLSKTSEPEQLVLPLLAAVDGWSVIPRAVLHQLATARAPYDAEIRLTVEERELWEMIARDTSVPQIAAHLHVSERTAKRLTAAVLRRLKVKSRVEAARLAGQLGLLDSS